MSSRQRGGRLLLVSVVCGLAAALPQPAPSGAVPAAPAAPPTEILDPGAPGPHAVEELAYDLGATAHRLPGLAGPVELQGVVWAPAGRGGAMPLVVVVHGRHPTCAGDGGALGWEWPCPAGSLPVPSASGFAALGRLLAAHGVVVVAISANGVSAQDAALPDGGAAARAELVAEHLRRWQGWSTTAAGSPFGDRFVGQVDLTRVGLVGHSRGADGVVLAAQRSQEGAWPATVGAVMAIAAPDIPGLRLSRVPLGVLNPYCDGDVRSQAGLGIYERSRYAVPDDPAPKSAFVLYGANHNAFNSVWSSGPAAADDAEALEASGGICEPGAAGRLAPADQTRAGAVLVAGYLRRYLQGEEGFERLVNGTAPIPTSARPARWGTAHLPVSRLDVQRWDLGTSDRRNLLGGLSQQQGLLAGLTCGQTLPAPPSGGPAELIACAGSGGGLATNPTGALDVGWVRRGAFLREPLGPAGRDLRSFDGLRFRTAVPDRFRNRRSAAPELSVVLEDASGRRASVPVVSRGSGLIALPTGEHRLAPLQSVRIPLSAFAGIDLSQVRAVELRFDRTVSGRLALADLAFTAEGTGSGQGSGLAPVHGGVDPSPCAAGAATRWACTAYQAVLGRDPIEPELAQAAAAYPVPAARSLLAAGLVMGPEASMGQLRWFGARYLQQGVAGFELYERVSPTARRQWERGRAEATELLRFDGTPAARAEAAVAASYETLLGRVPDPGGRAYWVARVSSEAGGLGALHRSLVATAEYRGRVVDGWYRQLLASSPDPAGRAYWVGRLPQAGSEQVLVHTLVTSEAFRRAAVG